MSWDANANALVVQLRTQLQACAAWTGAGGALDQIHFPDADYAGETLPAATITQIPGAGQRAYFGVAVLPSGTFEIIFIDDTSLAQIEDLAQSIGQQICTDIGIAGLEVENIDPADVSSRRQQIAEGGAIFECVLTLRYGLEV